MKRTLSIFLVLLFAFEMVNGQVIESKPKTPQQEMYDFYSVKHEKLKKTGFILLGVGVGLTVGAFAVAAISDSWDGIETGALMFVFGSISTVASIPVLIISGSKKRKAKTYLEGGIGSVGNITFDNSKYASIGLKIDF